MPRRDAFDADTGDHEMAPPDRFSDSHSDNFGDSFQSFDHNASNNANSNNNNMDNPQKLTRKQQLLQPQQQEEDSELMELERRLNEEVDEDFFEEPRKFNTLSRVIDVLGLQMIDDATMQTEHSDIGQNPAYRNLKGQQRIVEGAIEHMAVIHCADLNGSVIQVGRVARQFSEAVSKVRNLRKQVRDIQDTLGANQANPNEAAMSSKAGNAAPPARSQNAAAMSLRELWLKKLECEATLSLLEKLDVIRAASSRFDALIRPPCRIGAAVLTISTALATMFSDDVAQVQALHKIMEQLMLRKQKSEEIIWDTLHDVLYLRTGNGLVTHEEKSKPASGNAASVNKGVSGMSSGHSVSSESRRNGRGGFRGSTVKNSSTGYPGAMVNPFSGSHVRFAVEEDLDDQSQDSQDSGASLFSLEDGDNYDESGTGTTRAASMSVPKRVMIPIPMIEAELDLEADERRCLEEIALSGISLQPASGTLRQRKLPRYADPVLALRILVECLAELKRLDDVERILSEGLEREIRQIVQREQARTFSRLEKKRVPQSIRSLGRTENMKDFRRHLTGLMSAFGCVMIRLSHLAEILRFRISSDKELLQKMESPSTVMRAVLTAAYEIMQRELKEFLKACLIETEPSRNDPMESSMRKGSSAHESGLFSLGIVESSAARVGEQKVSTATRSNVMEMTATKFVSTVLFPKTKVEPQARHALTFRRSVARWTAEIEALKKELATLTGEDMSTPSFNYLPGETAIQFLDNVIQEDLLPVLQEEAVNGTVKGLESRDAFDPVFGRNMYARPNSSEPQDVEICIACQAMYQFTGPLFLALHRLPPGGEMYLPLVAVLEHVILTFKSRVLQQVGKLCNNKTAYTVLKADGKIGAFASIMERRKPYAELLRAYADGDLLETSPAGDDLNKQPGLMPLSPPTSDTAPRRADLGADGPVEDLADGVEGEEMVLDQELVYLKQYLDFSLEGKSSSIIVCSDEEMMKAACLAHSLLKLASLLESRLKTRGHDGFDKALTSTRALRDAIKTIKLSGVNMVKFCRVDMLMQNISRLSKICKSSTIVARDAVRIPSSVNDLGEYLTGASDNLREAAGSAVTAYTFSSLEQYIPLCLMQTVRVIAAGKGVVAKSPLTMNGIEALDRSGSVLYRDLKGATSFDNSFWDVELAAMSFERSASFMAMLELEMEELCAYYAANQDDFSEADFELMFSMAGPRRRGDVGRLHMMKRRDR